MVDTVTPEKRSWIMRQITGKDTHPERVLRQLLHAEGYRFRLHRNDLPGKPDIVLPKYRVVIFVHGCFWHGHECQRGRRPKTNEDYWNRKLAKNAERDRMTREACKDIGWKPIVIWECEMKRNSRAVLDRLMVDLPKEEN